jgi:uncharacterized protein (TIGR00645 family)
MQQRHNIVEQTLERVLFHSRWMMVPFYLGLCVALAVLIGVFVYEVYYLFTHLFEIPNERLETSVLLWLLSLIDLSLAANLVLMVVLAGYENFVSKMEVANHPDRPDWMGKIDFSGMKLKLIASIVAISAIYLLRAFMSVGQYSDRELAWLVLVHVVFVVSGVLLALMDFVAEKSHAVHAQHMKIDRHGGQP